MNRILIKILATIKWNEVDAMLDSGGLVEVHTRHEAVSASALFCSRATSDSYQLYRKSFNEKLENPAFKLKHFKIKYRIKKNEFPHT